MPRFRIDVVGLARVHGYIVVEAETQDAAGQKVIAEKLGDITWEYEEFVDDTAEIEAWSEAQPGDV